MRNIQVIFLFNLIGKWKINLILVYVDLKCSKHICIFLKNHMITNYFANEDKRTKETLVQE